LVTDVAITTTANPSKELFMSTSNIVWIVVAVVVAVLLLATLVVVTRRSRHLKAERIREEARLETNKLERREALGQETAARARAAQAEAEAKAAEAARLQERAAAHQSETATARESLNERWEHADRIDPKAKARAADDREANGRSEVPSEGSGHEEADAEHERGGLPPR
jgi:uncharacterized protein HemX